MRREETTTISGQATVRLRRLTTRHNRATARRGQVITPRDPATARLSQAIALPVAIAGAEVVALHHAAITEAVEARAHREAIPAAEVAEEADHMAEVAEAVVATPTAEAVRT